MSAVTNQPLPYDRLEREKHIHMIFRAFQNCSGPPCQCHTHLSAPKHHEAPAEQQSVMVPENQQPGKENRPGIEQWAGGASESHFLSVLETVREVFITARPELQGPHCVPRRIYSISTGDSRPQLFVAVEETSCVCLQCCGPARACSLKGFDTHGRQIFYFERPLRVDACCLGCCLMEIRAYTPQKHLIGTVYQRWSMFTPLLEVCVAEGASVATIQGYCCPCRCLTNQQFQIVSSIGEKLGTIWKKWPGLNEEQNMDHEYFGFKVPLNMDPHTKLLLLAATFLLNHMFFEMS
ncbi:uncharacterized protein V6R79_019268 [Siganus canaliculatus]